MNVKVNVAPNPFTTELIISISCLFTMNAVVRLLNNAGSVIRIAGCTLNKGDNRVTIENLGRYAIGDYLLEVKLLNGDLLESISLIKK